MQLNLSPVILLGEMAKNQIQKKSDIDCKFFENASDVPDPRELSPDKKNIMVFDDLLLEKNRTSANRITPEVGIVTWTVST